MTDKTSHWWVIVVYKGEFTAIGPYSESGAKNMFERTTKGDVHIHKSWYGGKEDHAKVIDEYKAMEYSNG